MASSEQNEFIIFVELDTGVRLDISDRVVADVEKTVKEFAPTRFAIKNVSSKVEGWSSKVYVTLNDLAERQMPTQEVINALRPEVTGWSKIRAGLQGLRLFLGAADRQGDLHRISVRIRPDG